jgi:hypothetical protein
MLPFRLRRGKQRLQNPPESSDSGSDASESIAGSVPDNSVPEPGPDICHPSLMEVLKVRNLLQWKISAGLPEELIDMIIDAAEYWPSTEHTVQEHKTIHKDCDQVLLKTVPLCYDRNASYSFSVLIRLYFTDCIHIHYRV